MPNLNPVHWSEPLEVDLNSLHDLRDISTSWFHEGDKNQWGREVIFQNNEKSSEIDNKTHT